MKKGWLTIEKEGNEIILIECSKDAEGDITIPEGITRICDYSFYSDELNRITSITIPSSVNHIGNSAFDGCSNLMAINVDANNKVYDSRNNCNAIIETATNTLVRGCQNTIIPVGVENIGGGAFLDCIGLKTIKLPIGLRQIGVSAFAGTGLTAVDVPFSVKSIDSNAFGFCKDLVSAKIPEHLYHSGLDQYDGEFEGCHCRIKKYRVTYRVNKRYYHSLEGDIYINHNVEDEEYKGCRKISSIKIANGVTKIGEHAFEDCANLESVSIPNSVLEIGASAFRGCKNLNNIKLPDHVKRIEKYTFEGCKKLEKIVLPPNLEQIDRLAFAGCESLEEIELPETLHNVGIGIFDYCHSLREITIMNTDMVFSDLLTKKEDYLYDVDVSKCTLVVPDCIDRFRLREYIDAFSPIERRVRYWQYE